MKDSSGISTEDVCALVGSRLCHDLINPLGAIGNGVELLAMMPGVSKPELALIEDAVRDAQARIRFFRIAFGKADPSGRISHRELSEILSGLYDNGGRLSVDWQSNNDLVRDDAKMGLLMLACVEQSLPLGGAIVMSESGGTFRLEATAKRISCDPELWGLMQGTPCSRVIAPAEVQFALFAQEIERQDRVVQIEITDESILVTA